MSPFYHAIEYANSNHVAANLTQYSIAIAGAGSVVGRIGTGLLADVVGAWRVYGGIGLISGIVMFAFWTPPNIGTAPTVLGLVFFGIVSGAWWSLIGSATAAISPVHENGMRIGMLITCCAIPTLVGPVICGGKTSPAPRQADSSADWGERRAMDVRGGVLRGAVRRLQRRHAGPVDQVPSAEAG